MVRFHRLQPGMTYRAALGVVSVTLALIGWRHPALIPWIGFGLLFGLPLLGYFMDVTFNRLVTQFQQAEAKIQGSFKKFEDREKQYQDDVGELQNELARLQQLNINLQEAKTFQQILEQLAEATHYILDFERTLIFFSHLNEMC